MTIIERLKKIEESAAFLVLEARDLRQEIEVAVLDPEWLIKPKLAQNDTSNIPSEDVSERPSKE